ncbi:phage shock protein PspA [Pseudaeromonas sp. ZJS20]|uniref:phage shock protein PspA n=1 Tax=Pseudaeromonas aegiceratis TaxID=3153928 RepID=UPI00390C8749
MGVFSRIADIVSANLNSLLDKAEDPQKMVRLIIQEMEEGLVQERSNLARYLLEQKELERQLKRYADQAQEWQDKAQLALIKGRDDLARAALLEKAKLTEAQKALQEELGRVADGISKLGHEIQQLEAKLQDARARQQAMTLRSATADSRLQIQARSGGEVPRQMGDKFAQMERKISELEARADIYSQGNPSLEQQFAELAVDDAIEQELASLKARMTGSQVTGGENKHE